MSGWIKCKAASIEMNRQLKDIGVPLDAGESQANEQVDEDLTVTQSQMNFICPITQEEMKKPVRNKTCGHTYEEEAILKIIMHKEKQKKKAWHTWEFGMAISVVVVVGMQ
uniref:Uncharacterized protein n=1 Tax=Sphaerodactylus townsendi TaxID=933632 RepID=A0ACB8FEI8_9SAUR